LYSRTITAAFLQLAVKMISESGMRQISTKFSDSKCQTLKPTVFALPETGNPFCLAGMMEKSELSTRNPEN
jgi:hypothetical protein